MPYPPKQIKAVIFDLDDTLIDWSQQELHGAQIGQRSLALVYDHLIAQGHTLLSREYLYDHFGEVLVAQWQEAKKKWTGVAFQEVMRQTLADCGLILSSAEVEHLLHVYDWQPIPGVRPYADALSVLTALKEKQYLVGLITNSMQPMWMRDTELAVYGILPFLDARITSGDVGYMKPHPAIYQHILHLLDIAPAQAIFVGDRPENDIVGANEAGLISVLMRPHHLNYDSNGIVPHFTIRQLTDLLPILEQLEQIA